MPPVRGFAPLPDSDPVEPLLRPISDAAPAGENLKYTPPFDELETAYAEATTPPNPAERRAGGREKKRAEWPDVVRIAARLLESRTKDLRVADLWTEAMLRVHGLPGLGCGLRLLIALNRDLWETLHPLPDRDPDLPPEEQLAEREAVLIALDKEARIPLLLRQLVPLSLAGDRLFGLVDLELSDAFETDIGRYPSMIEKARSDPNNPRELDDIDTYIEKRMEQEGRVRRETYRNAVLATPTAHYVELDVQVRACLAVTNELNTLILDPARYGRKVGTRIDGPVLSEVRNTLEAMQGRLDEFLADRDDRGGSDQASDDDAPDAEDAGSDGASTGGADGGGEAAPDATFASPVQPVRPAKRTTPARTTAGPIGSAEDATARVVAAAAWLRQQDPADPKPYLLVRALGMGESYLKGTVADAPGPDKEERLAIRQHLNDGASGELLERVEAVVSGPAGRGWLDAQRFAVEALEALGHDAAARAVRALVAAWLADLPDWPDAELDDSTPAANAATREWAAALRPAPPEGATAEEAEPPAFTLPPPPPPPTDPDEDGRPSPRAEAATLVEAGRTREAIALLARAARAAATGRDRFVLTLDQAEICTRSGLHDAALPLLEGLTRQIDELHLDRWEDSSLCGRAFAALYACLRGRDDARAQAVYTRLCQLDIDQALALGAP